MSQQDPSNPVRNNEKRPKGRSRLLGLIESRSRVSEVRLIGLRNFRV